MKELQAIVEDAIRELTNQECPYCQANIGANRFYDEAKAAEWLAYKVDEECQKADEETQKDAKQAADGDYHCQ